MAFNHYARLAKIIASQKEGWYIKRIDKPTVAKNFRGDKVYFDHYYRLYSSDGDLVPYGKFQQIDRLARALKVDVSQIPIID